MASVMLIEIGGTGYPAPHKPGVVAVTVRDGVIDRRYSFDDEGIKETILNLDGDGIDENTITFEEVFGINAADFDDEDEDLEEADDELDDEAKPMSALHSASPPPPAGNSPTPETTPRSMQMMKVTLTGRIGSKGPESFEIGTFTECRVCKFGVSGTQPSGGRQVIAHMFFGPRHTPASFVAELKDNDGGTIRANYSDVVIEPFPPA